MKTLHIIRHFKSDWDGEWTTDFERTLNDRGRNDIPLMASKLLQHGVKPQAIFHSSAMRTTLTCHGLVERCGWRGPVYSIPELYGAGVTQVLNLIHSVDDQVSEIAVIGHNPTMTEVINFLSNARLDNLPTGGWAQIEFDRNTWKEIDGQSGRLIHLDYPKK